MDVHPYSQCTTAGCQGGSEAYLLCVQVYAQVTGVKARSRPYDTRATVQPYRFARNPGHKKHLHSRLAVINQCHSLVHKPGESKSKCVVPKNNNTCTGPKEDI